MSSLIIGPGARRASTVADNAVAPGEGAIIDRRVFCWSAIAMTASLASPAAFARALGVSGSVPLRPCKVVVDSRFRESLAFGAAAERPGTATIVMDGDITAAWLEDLAPHWAGNGGAVVGMTTARTLMCLEQLAHDTWRRVLTRVEHRGCFPELGRELLVSWMIGKREQREL